MIGFFSFCWEQNTWHWHLIWGDNPSFRDFSSWSASSKQEQHGRGCDGEIYFICIAEEAETKWEQNEMDKFWSLRWTSPWSTSSNFWTAHLSMSSPGVNPLMKLVLSLWNHGSGRFLIQSSRQAKLTCTLIMYFK